METFRGDKANRAGIKKNMMVNFMAAAIYLYKILQPLKHITHLWGREWTNHIKMDFQL